MPLRILREFLPFGQAIGEDDLVAGNYTIEDVILPMPGQVSVPAFSSFEPFKL